MEELNIKQVLLNKEKQFWLSIVSILLRTKNIVDKRIAVLYTKLNKIEPEDKKNE